MTYRYLIFFLKQYKIENKDENPENFWMFTYDFKAQKIKNVKDLESKDYIRQRKFKNLVRVLLYLNVLLIVYLISNFLTQILIAFGL